MKRVFASIVLLFCAARAGAAMSRVVSVENSHTIVVETKGARSTVVLRDVAVAAADRLVATDYVRRILSDAWVYIEDGEVYRSPDGLHVNGALRRRAWSGAIEFGALHSPGKGAATVVVIGSGANTVAAPALKKSPLKKKSPVKKKRRSKLQ